MIISKEDRKIVQEILSKLPENIDLIQTTQYKCNNQQQQMQKMSRYLASERFLARDISQFEKLKQNFKEVIMNNKIIKELFDSLSPIYQIGDQFLGFPTQCSYRDGEFITLNEKSLKLSANTIIFFWETTNKDAILLLEQLQLEFHQSKEFQFTNINIDKDISSWQKYVSSKLSFSDYADLSQQIQETTLLNIKKTPYIIILDREDRIVELLSTPTVEQIKKRIIGKQQQQQSKQDLNQYKEIKKNQQQLQSKADFKKIQCLIQNEIMEMTSALFDSVDLVEFRLLQVKQIFNTGIKTICRRSKLLVSVQIENQKFEMIGALKEFLSSILNSDDFIIIRQTISFINDQEQLAIQNILTDLSQQVGICLTFHNIITHEIVWDSNENTFLSKSQGMVMPKMLNLDQNQVKLLEQTFSVVAESLEEKGKMYYNLLMEQLLAIKDQGDTFGVITEYYDKADKMFPIQHQIGQVLAIIWLIPCAFIVFKIEKFYQKLKEKYGETNIRLVYLSLRQKQAKDEDIEVLYRVNPQAEFYYPKDEVHPSLKQYKVDLFPFALIIDQRGKIQHSGIFNKFEDKIAKIFAKEMLSKDEEMEINIEQLFDFLLEQNIINSKFGQNKEFQFSIKIKSNEQDQLQAQINYFVRQKYSSALKEFLQSLDTFIPRSKLTINEVTIRAMDIPYPGKECNKCKIELSSQKAQYYNYFKKEFYCCSCSEAKVNDEYQIHDNLVFINTPISDITALTDIDVYRFGENIHPDSGEDISFQHEYCCNGCSKSDLIGERYIIINNQKGRVKEEGYSDYCTDCFNNIKNKKEGWNKSDDVNENSVFLRLPYYYSYHRF